MAPEPVLTVQQVADHLQIHKAGVYRLMKAGSLPYFVVAHKHRRIRESDLQAFIEGRTEPSPD